MKILGVIRADPTVFVVIRKKDIPVNQLMVYLMIVPPVVAPIPIVNKLVPSGKCVYVKMGITVPIRIYHVLKIHKVFDVIVNVKNNRAHTGTFRFLGHVVVRTTT